MSESPEQTARQSVEEPPPFLGSWSRVYLFVLCYLSVLIGGFYLFSKALAP